MVVRFLFHVRQVELPSYLQESRIVSRPKQGLIEYSENDRWGEPLEDGIARVLGLNLSERLDTLSYSVSPNRQKPSCTFEFGITVQRFERVDSQAVLLGVLCDLHSTGDVKHLPFRAQVDIPRETDVRDPAREVLALKPSAFAVVGFSVPRGEFFSSGFLGTLKNAFGRVLQSTCRGIASVLSI